MCLSGKYEGKVVLYEKDNYPFNCIGPIRFLWKFNEPKSHEENKINSNPCVLWIWSHPSIYKQVESQLVQVFDLQVNNIEPNQIKIDQNETVSESGIFKSLKGNIILKSLKDKLVRFKLLGPLSTTLLAHVLKTIEAKNDKLDENHYENQAETWNKIRLKLKEPNDIVPSTVIGLLVKDPRLIMPKKKLFNKVKEKNESINSSLESNQGKFF